MPKKKRKRKDKDDGSSKDKVKYTGVYQSGKKFVTKIYTEGKLHYQGTFDTAKKAAKAYDRAAIQAGRPTSKLNFVAKSAPKKKKLKYTNKKSGYRGVSMHRNKFQSTIRIDGRNHYLGNFDTTKEAAIAYDFAAIQAKRPKTQLNFPDSIIIIEKRKI